MEIKLQLNEDFERTLNALRCKYGSDFEYINGIHSSQLDYSEFLNRFVQNDTLADASIDPNANANHKDIRSFITEKGKSSDKLFALNKIFIEIKQQWGLQTAKTWLEEEFSKGFYLNDAATSSYLPYCYAVDLSRLAREGLFFLPNYNNCPPKHLTTFLDDVIEFVSFLSNRQSGAVGLTNVIIWSYYFWRKDCENGFYIKNPDYYLRQSFQKLIYRLNQPFLRLDQTAFTNLSIFDRYYLEGLFGGVEFPDGTFAIDCFDEILECQKTFMEVVSEIRKEQMFTFPVLTYSLLAQDEVKTKLNEIDKNIIPIRDNVMGEMYEEYKETMSLEEFKHQIQTPRNGELATKFVNKLHEQGIIENIDMIMESLTSEIEFKDPEFARWCSDHNVEWQDSNFFISDNVGILSNCCRLLSDSSKLDGFINSIGGTALSIGSCRVSTINLVRIVYESGYDKAKYLSILKDKTTLNCKALCSMRHILERNIEKGLLPNYCEGGLELSKQYCTIGILGLYEVIDQFGLIQTDEFGNKSYTDEAIEFAKEIFAVINDTKDNFECNFTFNVESIPKMSGDMVA